MLYQHCKYFKDISCLKNKASNIRCYELKCCKAIQEYQHFGKTCCLHLQDQSKGQQSIPVVWTGCMEHSHQVHVWSTGNVRKPVLRTTLFLSHGNCENIALFQGHCRREIGSSFWRQRGLYSFKEQMGGFHDLCRENTPFLFMVLGQRSVSVTPHIQFF